MPIAYGGSQCRGQIRPFPAYATATVTWDPIHICNLHHSSQHLGILNPLSKARDRTCNLMVPSRQIPFHCTTTGTSKPESEFSWILDGFIIYATPTATQDPSHVCNPHHSFRQCQILNLLRGGPEIKPEPSWILVRFITTEPQEELFPS